MYQWSKTFLFIAFLYAGAATIDTDQRIVLSLVKAIVVSGILVAGMGLLQLFDVFCVDIPGHFIPRATMGNKNLLASALFLHVPFVLYGVTQFRGKWRKGAAVAMLLIGLNIVAAGSRAVWLAVGVSGSIVVGVMLRVAAQREAANRVGPRFGFRIDPRQWYLPVLPALIGILFLTLSLAHPKEMLPHAAAATDSLRERMALWEQTVRMAASAPLRGVGTGQWKLHLPAQGAIDKHYEARGLAHEVVFQRPHNDFLWVLAENGIPGLVCLLCFYGVLLQRSHRLVACAREASMRHLGACMLFGLIGYLVISLFSFPRERIFHNLLMALMAAVILSSHPFQRAPDTRAPSGAKSRPAVLLPVLCFLCVLLGYGRLRADIQVGEALMARDAEQWERVVRHVDRAYGWYYTLDPLGTPLAWYRGMAHYRLGNVEQARNDFEIACRDHPFHFHALNNAAACHAVAGDWGAARRYGQRARRVAAPRRPTTDTTGDGPSDDRLFMSNRRYIVFISYFC